MNDRNLRSILALICICLSAGPLVAQSRRTIPVAVKLWDKSQGPLYWTRAVEYGAIPFGQMVRDADLILLCSLRVTRTYLSDDQTALYTEYIAAPTEVFAQRGSRVGNTPGPNPVVIRQWGGRMTVDGVEVIAEDSTIKLLPTDVPLLLFLVRHEKSDRYLVHPQSVGALAVEQSRVRPLHKTSGDYTAFMEMEYKKFLSEFMRERKRVVP